MLDKAIEITVDDYVNMKLLFISQSSADENGVYWTVWEDAQTETIYKIKTYSL
jgi:hypothetical protein